MPYVDGFVLAVKTAKKADYQAISDAVAALYKKHGALSVYECWGDEVPDGDVTSFPMAVKCQDDETVVFSWVVWPSKETRETGNKAFMEDPAANEMPPEMPFDGKRIIMGGFEVMTQL